MRNNVPATSIIPVLLLVVICVVVIPSVVLGQERDSSRVTRQALPADTSRVVLKKFSSEQINTLKADPELNYEDPPSVAQSLWARFLRWLVDQISRFFRNTTAARIGEGLLYALGLTVVSALILALLRVNGFRMFFKGNDAIPPPETLEENIHEMDFEKLILDATAKNDFRIATRLIFLYSLKILSDRQLIQWNPGKTNHDYVQEIRQGDLKDGFAELSFYFGYAWYGNFTVTPEIFSTIHTAFYNWRARAQR